VASLHAPYLRIRFLGIKSPKTWKSAIFFFHSSRHETNTFPIFHIREVKTRRCVKNIFFEENFLANLNFGSLEPFRSFQWRGVTPALWKPNFFLLNISYLLITLIATVTLLMATETSVHPWIVTYLVKKKVFKSPILRKWPNEKSRHLRFHSFSHQASS
jgi:hypothetical protein